mmetsp:Transcript_5265/g.11274  ORF Transcript_5265/g.11274 Transcript_5265/m.11274 type:complete len:120 (+) Transcript_5265:58-417(+)
MACARQCTFLPGHLCSHSKLMILPSGISSPIAQSPVLPLQQRFLLALRDVVNSNPTQDAVKFLRDVDLHAHPLSISLQTRGADVRYLGCRAGNIAFHPRRSWSDTKESLSLCTAVVLAA